MNLIASYAYSMRAGGQFDTKIKCLIDPEHELLDPSDTAFSGVRLWQDGKPNGFAWDARA